MDLTSSNEPASSIAHITNLLWIYLTVPAPSLLQQCVGYIHRRLVPQEPEADDPEQGAHQGAQGDAGARAERVVFLTSRGSDEGRCGRQDGMMGHADNGKWHGSVRREARDHVVTMSW